MQAPGKRFFCTNMTYFWLHAGFRKAFYCTNMTYLWLHAGFREAIHEVLHRVLVKA